MGVSSFSEAVNHRERVHSGSLYGKIGESNSSLADGLHHPSTCHMEMSFCRHPNTNTLQQGNKKEESVFEDIEDLFLKHLPALNQHDNE